MGVEIVANDGPALDGNAQWTLSPEPVVVIPLDGRNPEQTPLDPAGPFLVEDGNLLVPDGMSSGWHELMVFSARGRYLRSYGRDGSGPCEFQQLWWAAPYRGDSIAALDYAAMKIAIFGPRGECAREVRLPRHVPTIAPGSYSFSGGLDGAFRDGAFLAYTDGYLDVSEGPGVRWYRHARWIIGADGMSSDSIGEAPFTQASWVGRSQALTPFGAFVSRVPSDSTFYVSTPDAFEVREFDRSGILRRVIRRPYTRQDVTAADRQLYRQWHLDRTVTSREGGPAAVARVERELERMLWPSHKPSIGALLIDSEGNLWVEHYRWMTPFELSPDPGPITWSVFDAAGGWVTDVKAPARFLVSAVSRSRVAGVWLHPTGEKEVRVYALRR